MKKLMVTCCALLMAALALPSRAQDLVPMAVFDLAPAGVPEKTAAAASGLVRDGLKRIGLFAVMDRDNMAERLAKKGLALAGCSDRVCASRAGRAISARKIALGEIGMLGNDIVLTVSVIDTDRGFAEYSARATARSVSGIAAAVDRLIGALKSQADGVAAEQTGGLPAPMYRCGNEPKRGDIVSLGNNRGMAAEAGARVKGLFVQGGIIWADVIWLDEKAKGQGNGGYLPEKFSLVSRLQRPGE